MISLCLSLQSSFIPAANAPTVLGSITIESYPSSDSNLMSVGTASFFFSFNSPVLLLTHNVQQ